MADTNQGQPPEDPGPRSGSPLEDIEQDLDTVDSALGALDSGDLEAAERLATRLEDPSTETVAPAE